MNKAFSMCAVKWSVSPCCVRVWASVIPVSLCYVLSPFCFYLFSVGSWDLAWDLEAEPQIPVLTRIFLIFFFQSIYHYYRSFQGGGGGGGGVGVQVIFDGTYGDFSKIPILPPTPSANEITKK